MNDKSYKQELHQQELIEEEHQNDLDVARYAEQLKKKRRNRKGSRIGIKVPTDE